MSWQGQFGDLIESLEFYETDEKRGFVRGARWGLAPTGGPINAALPSRAGDPGLGPRPPPARQVAPRPRRELGPLRRGPARRGNRVDAVVDGHRRLGHRRRRRSTTRWPTTRGGCSTSTSSGPRSRLEEAGALQDRGRPADALLGLAPAGHGAHGRRSRGRRCSTAGTGRTTCPTCTSSTARASSPRPASTRPRRSSRIALRAADHMVETRFDQQVPRMTTEQTGAPTDLTGGMPATDSTRMRRRSIRTRGDASRRSPTRSSQPRTACHRRARSLTDDRLRVRAPRAAGPRRAAGGGAATGARRRRRRPASTGSAQTSRRTSRRSSWSIVGGYYTDKRVRELIGYPGQMAIDVRSWRVPEYIEEGLIDAVLARGSGLARSRAPARARSQGNVPRTYAERFTESASERRRRQ